MKIRSTVAALTAIGALGVGALTIPAFAQDLDVPATEEENPTGLRDQVRDRAKELFAAELDVTVEELEAAHAATREQLREEFADEFEVRREERRARMLEHVDRAVETGRITEEEADVVRERIEDDEPPFGGSGSRFRRGHHGLGGPGGPDGAPLGGASFLGGGPAGDA